MTTTKKTLGGARPGAGRKPKVAGAPAVAAVTIKMSPEQKTKLQQLGGPTWVRGKIDKAKVLPLEEPPRLLRDLKPPGVT